MQCGLTTDNIHVIWTFSVASPCCMKLAELEHVLNFILAQPKMSAVLGTV